MYKPPPRLNIPTPQQCWSTHVPETQITVPQPQQSPPLPVSAMLPKEPTPMPPTPAEEYTVQSPHTAEQKKVRVQSATFRRITPSKPTRPVRSAGPVRPSPSPVSDTPQEHVEDIYHSEPNFQCSWPLPTSAINIDDIPAANGIQFSPDRPPSGRLTATRTPPSPAPPSKRATPTQRFGSGRLPPSGKRTPLRPKAPSPHKMDIRLQDEGAIDRCDTPDYDEETRKHGWMMEVHGDPLKLK